MAKQYFIRRSKKIVGPLDVSTLKQSIKDGKTSGSDMVGPAREGPWKRIDSVPALNQLLPEPDDDWSEDDGLGNGSMSGVLEIQPPTASRDTVPSGSKRLPWRLLGLIGGGCVGLVVASVLIFNFWQSSVIAANKELTRVKEMVEQEPLILRNKERRAVTGVAFSPDNNSIAASNFGGTVEIWNAETGGSNRRLVHHRGFGDEGTGAGVIGAQGHAATSVAYSRDGTSIISSGSDYMIRIWGTKNGNARFILRSHKTSVNGAAFSPDGKRAVSAGEDKTVRVWGEKSGIKSLISATEHGSHRLIASATLVLEGHRDVVYDVSFSPDGTLVASASHDKTLRIWYLEEDLRPLKLEGHTGPVTSLSFSPDGTQIASGSHDSTVRVWNTKNGKEKLVLKGHSNRVLSVCFSPDGSRIASSSLDGTVKVWDVGDAKESLTLTGHQGAVTDVSFSEDGRRLASGGEDGTVRVWDRFQPDGN